MKDLFYELAHEIVELASSNFSEQASKLENASDVHCSLSPEAAWR